MVYSRRLCYSVLKEGRRVSKTVKLAPCSELSTPYFMLQVTSQLTSINFIH